MQFSKDARDTLLVLDKITTSYVTRVNIDVQSIRIYALLLNRHIYTGWYVIIYAKCWTQYTLFLPEAMIVHDFFTNFID